MQVWGSTSVKIFLEVNEVAKGLLTLDIPNFFNEMPKSDAMINGRVQWPKSSFPFSSFTLFFCPSVDSTLQHAPKKFSTKRVDHNSVVISEIIDVSTFV